MEILLVPNEVLRLKAKKLTKITQEDINFAHKMMELGKVIVAKDEDSNIIKDLQIDKAFETGDLKFSLNESDIFNTILSSKLATVFRDEANENLPTTSTLGKKQSDYVGEINFNPIDNLSFEYNYSLDNNLNQINLHNFKNTFKVNNFVNTFTFYEENNLIGDKSFYENEVKYSLNDSNSFSFKTRNNKKDNLTEFYNLIYEYKNDCLTASVIYNKEYYSNSSLKPSEELFFNITLVPLGSTKTDSILD